MHSPGTKLIEEGVDKNHGFSKCVEFVSFLFFIHLSSLLFFFDASMCMCGGRMLWWVGSRVAWFYVYICVCGCVCAQKMVSDKPRQAGWARGLDDTSSTVGPTGSVFSRESGDRRAFLEF